MQSIESLASKHDDDDDDRMNPFLRFKLETLLPSIANSVIQIVAKQQSACDCLKKGTTCCRQYHISCLSMNKPSAFLASPIDQRIQKSELLWPKDFGWHIARVKKVEVVA